MGVFVGFVVVALLVLSAYHRWSPKIYVPALVIVLILFSVLSSISMAGLLFAWIVTALIAVATLVSPLRRRLFSAPLMKWFKRQQPPISQAEQQVLDAGGLWWEQAFFTGRPDWKKLHELKQPSLTEAEQSFLDNQVAHLCSLLDDWEVNHELNDLPQVAWDYIKQEKFWGMVVDPKYGGLGFSAVAHSSVVAKIASRSYSAALTVMVPNSLGPAEFLSHYGTDAQKDYYLPRLVHGEEIACFGLTSPIAGSDATSLIDEGVICHGEYRGEKMLGIKLNFEKRYLTLAPVATLVGLAFKLYDPEHLVGEKDMLGITLCLVPTDLPGVQQGERHYPLNMAFMNGPVRGKDVFIPLDLVIGGQERLGDGWRMLMECLSIGRGISLPALATATTQVCYKTTGAYARLRQQFKRSIGDFEGVQQELAKIAGFNYLCEATRLYTAQAVDSGARPSITSAMTKYHLTELARQAVASAMDVHAGRAVQVGPRNYLFSMHEGIPISVTVEGANILTRNLIIFGQGALRCHPYLQHEIKAAMQDDTKQFDELVARHLGFDAFLVVRSLWYSLTKARFTSCVNGPFAYYYRQLNRLSVVFALTADLSMAVLGGKLKIREALSARLGDMLSYFYLASSVLRYAQFQTMDQAEQDYVKWALQYCLAKSYEAWDQLLRNFPKRCLARLLRLLCFPFSRGYAMPDDQSSHRLAQHTQRTSTLRDRLSHLVYTKPSVHDVLGRVEYAFQADIASQPLYQKIEEALRAKRIKRGQTMQATIEAALAVGVLTEQESEQLLTTETLRWDALQVDEFSDTQKKGTEKDHDETNLCS